MSHLFTSVRVALAASVLMFSAGRTYGEFTAVAGWDRQLFPSYLVATATIRLPEVEEEEGEAEDEGETAEVLGDVQGVLGVAIESPADDASIKVTIISNEILEPSTFVGTLEEEGGSYIIFPQIKYKYAVLARNKQSVPVSVTFRVEIDDEETEEQTLTLTLRSVNDCPFTIVNGDDDITDVSYMFAAYVNEQHPFVDKMLREALDGGVVESFTGYQSGDPAEVYRQVYALWDALSERDVRYSNITASAAESDAVYCQHVRLIDESINNAQANCVDGSVLFASLLRKVDIEPLLVFVPGHCYVAFFLDPEGKQLVALETTLIGSAIDKAPVVEGLSDAVDDDVKESASWATFCAAVACANRDLAENMEKFEDPEEADYQLIPIAAARRMGILPIAFDAAGRFEPAHSAAE